MSITIERRLAIINGYVEVPDGQLKYRTALTPTVVTALYSGASYESAGTSWNPKSIVLPAEAQVAGPAADYFQGLRDAAATVTGF